MKLSSLSFTLLVLLIITTSITVRPQTSFKVASIRPYDKAVPGQVMEVLVEGITQGTAPAVLPPTDFKVEVSQDGVTQTATLRITKFTMMRDFDPKNPGSINDNSAAKMRVYHVVTFVVPKGLHPGPAEVITSYKGKRGKPVAMERNAPVGDCDCPKVLVLGY